MDGCFSVSRCCRIAVELALTYPHLRRICDEVIRAHDVDCGVNGSDGNQDGPMWDEEDGFFYDVLRLPDGQCRHG